MVAIRVDWPKYRLRELVASTSIADENYSVNVEAIERELNAPTPKEKGVFANRLNLGAHSLSVFSVLQLLNGEIKAGWKEMARSLQFELASFKIRAAMGFPNYSWMDTNRACLLLCAAIALQSESVAKWLAELIVSSYHKQQEQQQQRQQKQRKKIPLSDWDVSPFEPFALRQACYVQGIVPKQLPRSKRLPEFYDELVAAPDLDATQRAIDKLALERVQLVSESYVDYPPFEQAPFDLFPVDLLAHIMVVHSGIPKFDFGALESPLCDPPLPFPHEKDPLVERVMERAKAILTVADVQWA